LSTRDAKRAKIVSVDRRIELTPARLRSAETQAGGVKYHDILYTFLLPPSAVVAKEIGFESFYGRVWACMGSVKGALLIGAACGPLTETMRADRIQRAFEATESR